jgi:hypothetical protein
VNVYANPQFINAEIERRFELAGVDPYDRHHHVDRRLDHGRPVSPAKPAHHPLASFVARLVGGGSASTPHQPVACLPQAGGRS